MTKSFLEKGLDEKMVYTFLTRKLEKHYLYIFENMSHLCCFLACFVISHLKKTANPSMDQHCLQCKGIKNLLISQQILHHFCFFLPASLSSPPLSSRNWQKKKNGKRDAKVSQWVLEDIGGEASDVLPSPTPLKTPTLMDDSSSRS